MHSFKLVVIAASVALVPCVVLADNRCLHPNLACGDIALCLGADTDQNDVTRIKDGAATGDGHKVWLGADACWTNKNQHKHWAGDSAGCLDPDYVEEAKRAISGGCPVQ